MQMEVLGVVNVKFSLLYLLTLKLLKGFLNFTNPDNCGLHNSNLFKTLKVKLYCCHRMLYLIVKIFDYFSNGDQT